jgi:methyl-accepting chemotaxis protein
VKEIVDNTEKDVSAKISEGRSAIDQGAIFAIRSVEDLNLILSQFNELKSISESIGLATNETAIGINDINKSIDLIESSALASKDSADSCLATVENLSGKSIDLKMAILNIELLVQGHKNL